jgi:hypothetical protein
MSFSAQLLRPTFDHLKFWRSKNELLQSNFTGPLCHSGLTLWASLDLESQTLLWIDAQENISPVEKVILAGISQLYTLAINPWSLPSLKELDFFFRTKPRESAWGEYFNTEWLEYYLTELRKILQEKLAPMSAQEFLNEKKIDVSFYVEDIFIVNNPLFTQTEQELVQREYLQRTGKTLLLLLKS